MKKMWIVVVVILGLAQNVNGQEQKIEEIKLDTDLLARDLRHRDIISAEQISGYSLSAHELSVKAPLLSLAELLGEESEQPLYLLGEALWSAVFETYIKFAEHEYGHLRVASRLGMTHFIGIENDGPPRQINSPSDLLDYAFNEDFSVSGSDEDWAKYFAPLDPKTKNMFLIIFEAGGLNQRQYTLERFSEKVIAGKANVFDGYWWFLAVNETLFYQNSEDNDIDDYVGHLEWRGIETSSSRVKSLSAIRYLSGSSLAMVLGTINRLTGGKSKKIEPLGFKIDENIRLSLPEFASYLTTDGPTIKASLPIKIGGIMLLPSFQQANESSEIGIGIRYTGFDLEFYKNSSGGSAASFGKEFQIEVSDNANLRFGAELYWENGHTLEREMNGQTLDFMEEEDWGVKVFLGLDVSF